MHLSVFVRATLGTLVCLGASWASAQGIDPEQIHRENLDACYVLLGRNPTTGAPVQSSGVCVDTQGLIMTTGHGVQGVEDLRARHPDGWETELTIEVIELAWDLALCRSSRPLPAAVPLGDAGTLNNGSPVAAIASPMGLDFSVTSGIVSNRKLSYRDMPIIQTDLLSEPGSSGGPVFDRRGRLIGTILGQIEHIHGTLVTPINLSYPLLERHDVSIPRESSEGMAYRRRPARNTATEKVQPLASQRYGPEALRAYLEGVRAQSFENKATAYRQAVRAEPAFYEAWFNLGVACGNNGDVDGAIEAYLEAGRLRPQAAEPPRNLGLLLLQARRTAESIPHLERAAALDPRAPRSHNELGEAYRQGRNLEQAEEAFRRALELDPRHAAAHYNLALLLVERGGGKEALRHFEQYLNAAPEAADRAEVEAWIRELKSELGDAQP